MNDPLQRTGMKVFKRRSSFKWVFGGLAILLFSSIFSCSTGKDATDFDNLNELNEFVDQGSFEIQHDWANPLRGTSIDLMGNSNYIRFKQDSVKIFLPYFGVRQFGAGYNSEGGIRYEGPLENLQVEADPDDESLTVEFEGQQGTENLEFFIKMYPNGKVRTSVNSNQRDGISYSGYVRELPEEVK